MENNRNEQIEALEVLVDFNDRLVHNVRILIKELSGKRLPDRPQASCLRVKHLFQTDAGGLFKPFLIKKSYRHCDLILSRPVRWRRYRTFNRIPHYSVDGFISQ